MSAITVIENKNLTLIETNTHWLGNILFIDAICMDVGYKIVKQH